MPSKKLRATSVLVTYNGNFTREQVRDHLQGKDIEVAMVVKSEDGNPHLHAIANSREKRYWDPKEFAIDETIPDISLQRHEGGKSGLYDYLRSQDSEPLYVTIDSDTIDKTIKIRKHNEIQKSGLHSMDTAMERLSTCSTMEDVETLWASGELPQNKTSKVWRDEWLTLQRVKIAKEVKELTGISFKIPVEFKPGDNEHMEWQNFCFNFDHDLSLEITDVSGRNIRLSKKQILSIHGDPGVGKTPSVKLTLEENGIKYYRVPAGSQPMQWFDGYMGEPVIWCDDTVMPSPGVFLNLVESDKLPVKGGFVPKDAYRVRWILTNNLCLRSQFNSYRTEQDRIKLNAIWARTQEIMMYPNEELREQQKNLFIYRGRIIDDKQEFIKLCKDQEMLEEKEIRHTEYELLEERLHKKKDPNLTGCIDGIKEKIQMGTRTVYLLTKIDGSKSIIE